MNMEAKETFQHTPGPWEYTMEGEHGFGNGTYAYGASVGKEGKSHLPGVAHILERYVRDEYGSDIPDRAKCEANARLIASAPTMLEALMAAQSILWMAKEYADGGGFHGPEMGSYTEAETLINQAIVKVKDGT